MCQLSLEIFFSQKDTTLVLGLHTNFLISYAQKEPCNKIFSIKLIIPSPNNLFNSMYNVNKTALRYSKGLFRVRDRVIGGVFLSMVKLRLLRWEKVGSDFSLLSLSLSEGVTGIGLGEFAGLEEAIGELLLMGFSMTNG
jgi:hypothetical protein